MITLSLNEHQVQIVMQCLDQAVATVPAGQRLQAASQILPVAQVIEQAITASKAAPVPPVPGQNAE